MAGRKKVEDKRESITIRLNTEEREYIEANGTGTTFASKLKGFVFQVNIKQIISLQNEAESIIRIATIISEESFRKVFEGTKFNFDGHYVRWDGKPVLDIFIKNDSCYRLGRKIDLRDWV